MAARTGFYANAVTGAGAPVPILPNGALDVNTLVANMQDRTPWQWYDTLKLGPGATVANSYSLFQQQKGTADQYNNSAVKTFVETNMLSGGMFTPPYDLLMKRIMVKFNDDANLYDIIQVVKFSYFELFIGEKVFYRGNLELHPAGMGLSGVTSQTAQAVFTNGVPTPYATRSQGDFSRYIPPNFNFGFNLYFPETVGVATNGSTGGTGNMSPAQVTAGQSATALPTLLTQGQGGAGLWMTIYLDGLTNRPVQ